VPRQSGYTFLELLCLLVCIGVFLSITSLTWIHYSNNFKTRAAAYRIKSALDYARQQAVWHHSPIIYCGSGDGVHCDGHWSQGQLVKVAGSTDVVLRKFSPFKNGEKIKFTANFGRDHALEFMSSGATHGQQGHFSLCSNASIRFAEHCLWVMVHLSGQIEIKEHRHG